MDYNQPGSDNQTGRKSLNNAAGRVQVYFVFFALIRFRPGFNPPQNSLFL